MTPYYVSFRQLVIIISKRTSMKININNSYLHINEDDVIYCTESKQIKEWYISIQQSLKNFKDATDQNHELEKIKVFKKTLGIKNNTYQLLDRINSMNNGKVAVYSKYHQFLRKAHELLDNETFQAILQIAKFGKIQDIGQQVRNADTKTIDPYPKNNPVYNRLLDINTEDIMDATDIELLTIWCTHLEFQLYHLSEKYKRDNDKKIKKTQTFVRIIEQAARCRLHELKNAMMEDAGILEIEINVTQCKVVSKAFVQVAYKMLSTDQFQQILDVSGIK